MATKRISELTAATVLAGTEVVPIVQSNATVKATVQQIANTATALGSFTAGTITPTATDGSALGSTDKQWSDFFIASGGVINWSNGNYTITHSSGLLTFSGGLAFSQQALSGAGAINLTTTVTELTTTGANALTLADGTEGQIKIITMITDGGDGTLTPTNRAGYSTITFNDVGDTVQLLFANGKWAIVSNYGCTVA